MQPESNSERSRRTGGGTPAQTYEGQRPSSSSQYGDYNGYAASSIRASTQPQQAYDDYGRPYVLNHLPSSSNVPADGLPPAYGDTPTYGGPAFTPSPSSYSDRKVDPWSQVSASQDSASRRPLPSPGPGSLNGRGRSLPAPPPLSGPASSLTAQPSTSRGARPLPGVPGLPRVPSQSGSPARSGLPPTPERPGERDRVISSSSTASPMGRSATTNARVASESWDRPPPPPPRPLPNPSVSYYTPPVTVSPAQAESPIYMSPSLYDGEPEGVTRSSTASSTSYFPSQSHSQTSGSASMTSASLSMSTMSDPHGAHTHNKASTNIGKPSLGLPTIQTPAPESSESSFYGKNLPPTPGALPMRTLDHARSFISTPSTVAFPSPHPAQRDSIDSTGFLDPDDASGLGSMMTRESSIRSNISDYSATYMPESSGRGASGSMMPIPHPAVQAHRRQSSIDPAPLSPSWGQQASSSNPPARWVQTKLELHQTGVGDGYYADDGTEMYDDDDLAESEEEANEMNFFNPALLSHVSVQLKDKVKRGRHIKGGIPWVGSFTGRDLITSIQALLPAYTRTSNSDRRFAFCIALSLQNQLWFVEVDWDIKPMQDSPEDVFRFMGEMEGLGGAGGDPLTGMLPSGVQTMATQCYSPSCQADRLCYSPRCPHKSSPDQFLQTMSRGQNTSEPSRPRSSQMQPRGAWEQTVDPSVLATLSDSVIKRQKIIHQAIAAEQQYEEDLTAIEELFIRPLRAADPPIVSPSRRLDEFLTNLFSNVLELRDCCRRLSENFAIRQREQYPLIQTIGDLYLEAAADFRNVYPDYLGNLPLAERVLNEELESNPDFRLFVEGVTRQTDRRRDIKHLIARPSAQLRQYPAFLEGILNASTEDDPDRDFLFEAMSAVSNLSTISQLKIFHASGGRGQAGKLQWHDLVPESQRALIDKNEQKRQMQIWELIQGEMEYVADLEVVDQLFVAGLREADIPIIERSRLEIFLDEAFHNYRSLLEVHSRLLESLQARQLEQHPHIGAVSDLIFDAALNWQEAYMEYVTHYPIAKAKIEEEKQRNLAFARFLEVCQKNPMSNKHDINHFTYRPVPRLLRYRLLLPPILETLKATGPPDHDDIETIPQVMELIDQLAKATQKGVAVNEAKVELWQFEHSLDGGKFGSRAVRDLDLLNPMRELIHKGKVFRQPESTIGSGSWSELLILLFDNYFVLAKPIKASRSQDRLVKWGINRRPIPLELLNLRNFSDPAQTRSLGLLKQFRGDRHENEPDAHKTVQSDSRTVYPFTFDFIGQGQQGGQYTLWTDSAAARTEWLEKLQHAKVLRAEVNDASKVFEMTPISQDTFFISPNYTAYAPRTDEDSPYTGRVTCSVPFVTPDRRSLVAVGCHEGVWIGLRHDPKSLRKVLHVKAVTQCAVLEDFGIFLVLADKSLLAYHLEALVPSNASPQMRSGPQKLSGVRDIQFFAVGQLGGRTLVIYMKKKGMDSVFRVLEPIVGRGMEEARNRRPFGGLLGQSRAEWFRVYKDFFIPTDALHVHFLKAKLAIVCAKGFEIMDLTDLKGGSIPILAPNRVKEEPAIALIARRCETAKPLGMFRSTESEFLLCYDTFGIYVDRHGEPNRDCQIIEWEGLPDFVAFHPPYLLLISSPFIEIRHIDTAKLLQIYTGKDIRCTWDGTGSSSLSVLDTPGPNGYGAETSSQEARIHIVQRPDESGGAKRTKGIGQHVFELTPTLLLNNPLLNPVQTQDSNYFPPAPPMGTYMSSTSSRDHYADYSSQWSGN